MRIAAGLSGALRALFLCGGTVAARERRGRTPGCVADPSGAVVPQAEVRVEAHGFKKKAVSSVTVRSGDQLALDFPLKAEAASRASFGVITSASSNRNVRLAFRMVF